MKFETNKDSYPSSKNEFWRYADIKSFSENSISSFLNADKVGEKAPCALEALGFDKTTCTCLSLTKNGLVSADNLEVSSVEFLGEVASKLETLVLENTLKSVLKLNENSPKILIEMDSSLAFSPSFLEIEIAENANVQVFILQDVVSKAFVNSLLKVNLKDNAKLKISFINNTASESLLYSKVDFNLGSYSNLELYSIQEGKAPSRVEYFFKMAKAHAHTEATCFIKNYDSCLHNLNTYQDHQVGDTSSNLTLRNVLDNGAKATFAGFVKIEKDAQCTSAKQSCKTLLLDKSAKINALPILEIEANDVECAHGCAVSMPDEEQVFYLKARGLSEVQAKDLIAQGFVNFDNALA